MATAEYRLKVAIGAPHGLRRGVLTLSLVLTFGGLASSAAHAAACAKDDFAAVVDQSGQVLRALAAENKAPFQDKLRQLKQKNGWTDQQFLTEARPYVVDDRIKALDEEANGLLTGIATLGDTSGAKQPDCTVLDSLKGNLAMLVDVVKAKWRYMDEKIDAALK